MAFTHMGDLSADQHSRVVTDHLRSKQAEWLRHHRMHEDTRSIERRPIPLHGSCADLDDPAVNSVWYEYSRAGSQGFGLPKQD